MYRAFQFCDLPNQLLYDILALRAEVFVVEQNSAYLDPDGIDAECIHICLMENDTLIGYARIVPPGVKFTEASIGRFVLDAAPRGHGTGKKLFAHSIEELRKRFGNVSIRIEAQHHLRDFYTAFGFSIDSEIYDWGGIPHVKMLKP